MYRQKLYGQLRCPFEKPIITQDEKTGQRIIEGFELDIEKIRQNNMDKHIMDCSTYCNLTLPLSEQEDYIAKEYYT